MLLECVVTKTPLNTRPTIPAHVAWLHTVLKQGYIAWWETQSLNPQACKVCIIVNSTKAWLLGQHSHTRRKSRGCRKWVSENGNKNRNGIRMGNACFEEKRWQGTARTVCSSEYCFARNQGFVDFGPLSKLFCEVFGKFLQRQILQIFMFLPILIKTGWNIWNTKHWFAGIKKHANLWMPSIRTQWFDYAHRNFTNNICKIATLISFRFDLMRGKRRAFKSLISNRWNAWEIAARSQFLDQNCQTVEKCWKYSANFAK